MKKSIVWGILCLIGFALFLSWLYLFVNSDGFTSVESFEIFNIVKIKNKAK